MPRNYANNNWRQCIYHCLRKRNRVENENMKDIIMTHNRLFDQSESLRFEAKQLNFQNEKLREELSNCQEGRGLTSPSLIASGSTSSIAVQQLEQKIYKLQEEVTDLHRKKSEYSQQLVELNLCLQERDKVLSATQHKLAEKETELMLAKETIAAKDAKVQEIEALNQLLRDEYQAINLICTSLEEKYQKSQEEIQELIQRWMILKAKDAERLNEENEAVIRKRQEKIEKDLKEAGQEARPVDEKDMDKFSTMSPICVSAALPSRPSHVFDGHEGEVNSLMFSGQGSILASGGSDRRIKLWNINHGVVDSKGILTGSNGGVNAIDFDCEETMVLGASNDFACRFWNVHDLRLGDALTGHTAKVMAAKFLPDSSKVITGSYDRTLRIWDLNRRCCTKTLFPASSCNDVVVSDSQLSTVISAHFDKTVKFYDIRRDEPVAVIGLEGKVTSLNMTRDGFYLLCAVRNDSLKIIDLRTSVVLKVFTQEGFHIGADYTRATFSPDGAFAACGSTCGSLFIWNVASGNLEKELKEHESCVIATTWHPNGKNIATCDKSKKIIIWSDI